MDKVLKDRRIAYRLSYLTKIQRFRHKIIQSQKMKNKVQWFEIATADLERAKSFYEKVFDLEFQYIEMPDSKMYMFGVPDMIGSAGCLVHSEDNKPSTDGSIIYFSCEDVATQAARVEEAGGKLIVPKTDIGEFGFFAMFIDTEGNRLGLHSNS